MSGVNGAREVAAALGLPLLRTDREAKAAVSVCPIVGLALVSLACWAATRRAVWAAHQLPAPARDTTRRTP